MAGGTTMTPEEENPLLFAVAERIKTLEHERDELHAEVERLKAEAKLYGGWARWKDGIWKISHPESGPSAEWIGELEEFEQLKQQIEDLENKIIGKAIPDTMKGDK